MRIALDAMGGDHAPGVNVEGAIDAALERQDLSVILVGDEYHLSRHLSGRKYPASQITVKHASEVVAMDDEFTHALRRKKDSSIKRAVEMVREGSADAVVSAGHSGIAMALALLLLGTSKGVDRPAIATVMPSLKKPFLLLDAGANADCTPENLLQFALMADAYAKLILGRPSPKISLLSIGEEPTKGNELTKEAFKMLKAARINFVGNVEGKDIFKGEVDVVVCDGFVGNVVLKMAEGLSEATVKILRREISSSMLGRFGYLFLKPSFKKFKKLTDYSEYGGAPLLGINGACIISHGRSSGKAIKNAIMVAAEFSGKKVHEAIAEEIETLRGTERAFAAS